MSNYAAGRRAEWRVKRLLLDAGAAFVQRSAGSKGPCDLTAFFDHAVFAIQVKKAKPTAAEHEELKRYSAITSCKWAMVWSNGGNIEQWAYWKGKPSGIKVPGL